MDAFRRKCNEVSELFDEFTKSVQTCLCYALKAIQEYAGKGENDTVKDLFKKTHEAESLADKYRRDIIDKLVKGAFMPDTRRDLMNLVENIDNVADEAEEVLDTILFIGTDLSVLDKEGLRNICELLEKQFVVLMEAVQFLFSDLFQAAARTIILQKIEADVDRLEESVTRKMNLAEDELTMKIFCHKLVKALADIADSIENAGDDIAIIVAVKRG